MTHRDRGAQVRPERQAHGVGAAPRRRTRGAVAREHLELALEAPVRARQHDGGAGRRDGMETRPLPRTRGDAPAAMDPRTHGNGPSLLLLAAKIAVDEARRTQERDRVARTPGSAAGSVGTLHRHARKRLRGARGHGCVVPVAQAARHRGEVADGQAAALLWLLLLLLLLLL
jgi:hypothetical protein